MSNRWDKLQDTIKMLEAEDREKKEQKPKWAVCCIGVPQANSGTPSACEEGREVPARPPGVFVGAECPSEQADVPQQPL